MSESHEALRVRIEAALRERWPEASVTVSDEFHYGRRRSVAGAVWAKTVSVFTGAVNRRGALELLAEAVCLELREHADYLEARRGALLDEIERLKRENATLRAAYAQDLDGLRAELRRATWTRDVIGEHHE